MNLYLKQPIGLFVISALLFLTAEAHSQVSYRLKLYQNSDAFTIRFTPENTEQTTFNFTRLSLAFSIEAKKLNHEIELLIPEINNPVDNIKFPMNYEFRKHISIQVLPTHIRFVTN